MKRVLCIILLIVFLAVFCVSGYKLINYYKVSHDSKAVYNDLADIKSGSGVHADTTGTPVLEVRKQYNNYPAGDYLK